MATVIDLATRMAVGWSTASHIRAPLIIDALKMARGHGDLDPTDAIFHSDGGTQYTSTALQAWCGAKMVTQSMGPVGVCWDNSVAEFFFLHMKTELYYQQTFETYPAARTEVMDYIET